MVFSSNRAPMRQKAQFLDFEPSKLIALLWSKPLRELADQIGISDVGMKRMLRAKRIPTPPRGYWAKKRAGKPVQSVPRQKPRGPGETGRVRLDSRFAGLVSPAKEWPLEGPFASELVPEDLEELAAVELKAIGKVRPARSLTRPHRGLSRILNKEEKRREKHAASGWDWDRPLHDHPLGQRQLRIADAILKTLARRGHDGDVSEAETGFELNCVIGYACITLVIERASGHRAPQREIRSSATNTQLRIAIKRTWKKDIAAEWVDSSTAKLEQQLAEIVAETIVAGERRFRQGLAEEARREAEFERWHRESEQREVARLEEQRLADLKASGKLLRQAKEIRELVAEVEAAIATSNETKASQEDIERWKAWALAQADKIDPIQSGQFLSHLRVAKLDDR